MGGEGNDGVGNTEGGAGDITAIDVTDIAHHLTHDLMEDKLQTSMPYHCEPSGGSRGLRC